MRHADTMAHSDLMTIGAFAGRTGLSRKALRLYADMGLMPPTFVDGDTGYRYYRHEQIGQAKLVALLRRLDMPLDRIAAVLDLDSINAALEVRRYGRQLQEDARAKRRLVRYLEAYLEGKEEAMFDIDTRHVPEQKVLTIQRHVHAPELPPFIRTSMHEILDHLSLHGLHPAGHPFVVFHGRVDDDSDGPVEMCVPFMGTMEPAGDMRIRMEPEHHEAYARVTKAQLVFPDILGAYDAVERHLRERSLDATGAPREVYFADWRTIADDDPACDIAWPFHDGGAAAA